MRLLQSVLMLVVSLAIFTTVGADIVVDDDTGSWMNYDNIQDAIDNATHNETIYVYEGVYNENVIVNQSVNIVGNDTSKVVVYGQSGDSVFNVSADYTNVTYLTVENNGTMDDRAAGIYIDMAELVQVRYCMVNGTAIGIYGINADDTDVRFTGVTNCSDDGLLLDHSLRVTLYLVNVKDCGRSGIEGMHSDGMTINYCNVYDSNTDDGADDGGFVFHYCDDLVLGWSQGDTNHRFGVLQRYAEDTFYYQNTMEDTIGGEGYYISSSPRLRMWWNDAYQNGGYGYSTSFVDDADISNNTAEDNDEHGFQFNGKRNWIADNNATANGWDGFRLVNLAGSDVVRCRAVNHTNSGRDGFDLDTIMHINFTECISTGNARDGFHFVNRWGTNMTNTTASRNGRYGIYFWAMNGANLTYNEIFNNTNYGLYIGSPVRNVSVHHNNFANNGGSSSQAYCDNTENNTFNGTGFGNYWDDWGGSGNYSIDGSAGLYDHYPKDKTVQTSAPEKVPEFGLLIAMVMLFAVSVVMRRK